ncbi:MAG: FlgO family outer membrane protein [Spirochaetales bacterium]|nr:FlgO family outer membrane protein [Spirochaetales bacterium]
MVLRIIGLSSLLIVATAGFSLASGQVYKEYSLDYPHPVTRDYVYRTPRVYQSGEGQPVSVSESHGGDVRAKTLIPAEEGTELALRVRELVTELLATSRENVVGELQVTVATFVNLDQLYETSGMGRYVSEQMIHELQRAGVDVVDVRMMPSMKISQGHGEYVLSRDMGELNYVHEIDAIVAGTYTVADGQIFLNGRLLSTGTGKVLSSGSTVFEVDSVIASLLQRSGQPVSSPAAVGIQSYKDLVE